MVLCKYYPYGRCLNGTRCRNEHTGPVQPAPCHTFVLYGRCRRGTECPYAHPAHPPAENPAPPRSTCKNFTMHGGCVYGSKCIYYHPQTTGSNAGPARRTLQSTWTTPSASPIVADMRASGNQSFGKISSTESTNHKVTPASSSFHPTIIKKAVSKVAGATESGSSTPNKSVGKISTPLKSPSSTLGLSSSRFATTTTPNAEKTAEAGDGKLSDDKSDSTSSTPSKNPMIAPALPLSLSTKTTPTKTTPTKTTPTKTTPTKTKSTVEKIANAADVKSSKDKPYETILAPSANYGTDSARPRCSSLTSVSTDTSDKNDVDRAFSKDTIMVHDSVGLVRSATQSPAPVDSPNGTAIQDSKITMLDQIQSDSSIAPGHSTDDTLLTTIPDDESPSLLITTPIDSSTELESASEAQPTHLDLLPAQLSELSVEATPVDNSNGPTISTIPVDGSTAPLEPALVESSSSGSESVSTVQPSSLSQLPDRLPDLLVESTSAAKEQPSEIPPNSTDDQIAINELSRVVIDWSVTEVYSNLELTGPGMYERQVCHSRILCTWSQEWNTPPLPMVETLTNFASNFGEIICQPLYRNTGIGNSLQITFKHPQEAATASAELNGQLINPVGTDMSYPVSVIHQITVTYMMPQFIIDSLGRPGQGALHTLFAQNSCHLQWNDSFRTNTAGEKIAEVTLMSVYEEQVMRCKAVLEDIMKGRVLTHRENDNYPVWHDFFETEEGTRWIRDATVNVFDVRVRTARMANLKVLMIYGSSEWSRRVFGGVIERKVKELVGEDKRAMVATTALSESRGS